MFKYSDKIFQLRDIQTIFLNPSIPQSNLLPCWGEIVFGGALIIGLNEIFQKIGGVDTGVEKGQIFNNINMFVFYL